MPVYHVYHCLKIRIRIFTLLSPKENVKEVGALLVRSWSLTQKKYKTNKKKTMQISRTGVISRTILYTVCAWDSCLVILQDYTKLLSSTSTGAK